MVLEFLTEATEEVAEATAHYEAGEPGSGVRFREEIERASAPILENPLLWRIRHGIYRRVSVAGHPYYISYFVRGDRVLIAAVAHASRQPDYWKAR